MFGQKQISGARACWVAREVHRGPLYIHPPRVCLVPSTAAQGEPLCPVLEDPQSWCAWASPSSSSSASPCFTSAPDVHPAPGRRFRPVSLEVARTKPTNVCPGKRCCISVNQNCVWILLCGSAAAQGDDVKSQIEKLWQEVNSLKEMQALQTGTLLNN